MAKCTKLNLRWFPMDESTAFKALYFVNNTENVPSCIRGTNNRDQIHEIIIEEPQMAKCTAISFKSFPMNESTAFKALDFVNNTEDVPSCIRGTNKLGQIHEMIIEEPQMAKGTALGFTWVPMEEDIPDIYLKLPLS